MVSADDVAVVIPVYNGVGIVDRCISALLRQSRVPGEIICVDDFSRDNTLVDSVGVPSPKLRNEVADWELRARKTY